MTEIHRVTTKLYPTHFKVLSL